MPRKEKREKATDRSGRGPAGAKRTHAKAQDQAQKKKKTEGKSNPLKRRRRKASGSPHAHESPVPAPSGVHVAQREDEGEDADTGEDQNAGVQTVLDDEVIWYSTGYTRTTYPAASVRMDNSTQSLSIRRAFAEFDGSQGPIPITRGVGSSAYDAVHTGFYDRVPVRRNEASSTGSILLFPEWKRLRDSFVALVDFFERSGSREKLMARARLGAFNIRVSELSATAASRAESLIADDRPWNPYNYRSFYLAKATVTKPFDGDVDYVRASSKRIPAERLFDVGFANIPGVGMGEIVGVTRASNGDLEDVVFFDDDEDLAQYEGNVETLHDALLPLCARAYRFHSSGTSFLRLFLAVVREVWREASDIKATVAFVNDLVDALTPNGTSRQVVYSSLNGGMRRFLLGMPSSSKSKDPVCPFGARFYTEMLAAGYFTNKVIGDKIRARTNLSNKYRLARQSRIDVRLYLQLVEEGLVFFKRRLEERKTRKLKTSPDTESVYWTKATSKGSGIEGGLLIFLCMVSGCRRAEITKVSIFKEVTLPVLKGFKNYGVGSIGTGMMEFKEHYIYQFGTAKEGADYTRRLHSDGKGRQSTAAGTRREVLRPLLGSVCGRDFVLLWRFYISLLEIGLQGRKALVAERAVLEESGTLDTSMTFRMSTPVGQVSKIAKERSQGAWKSLKEQIPMFQTLNDPSVRTLRAIYANVAHWQYARDQGISLQLYISHVLGHKVDSLDSVRFYSTIFLENTLPVMPGPSKGRTLIISESTK
jgi:hypothetical protein